MSMYLKRLESVGFKSFAERINVEFVPGVTAVVGPNGSGKSNITDAMRWVLGEQSAKSLRGTKMEDIIFQGSDSRKALNVAEVTLVLDNSDHGLPLDFDEVSVTRRVYRSGESEFYINKQSCRLKDIVDLFLDSGLGKEAFSIISQGKVEEILSSKAEERRTIFEEAAGVLKYKQRKKKAEYKLAETQENLNRVEDIIYEIENQLDPLKAQAETAKEYLKQKELLKKQEISLLITEIETLHDDWQSILKEIESDKMAEIELKTVIQKKEAALTSERQEIDRIDDKINELQERLLTTTQQLEQYEGKKQVFHERTKHYTENKEKLDADKVEAERRIQSLELELNVEESKLKSLLETRQKTKQVVEELRRKLTTDKESLTEQIEDLKSEYIEFLNQQAAKRNEKQSIAQQLQQISGKKDIQEEKFHDLLKQREDRTKKLEEAASSLQVLEDNYRTKDESIKQLKLDIEKWRSHYQDSQTKLFQGYQYIEKLKSKKEMLEEMKEDFQGFFQGVKAVLKAREEGKLSSIHGAVIELIDVPKNYITAIETVLGGQAQHIVVENDEAARQAINWLKKTNGGRATFLPLGSIQPRYIPQDVLTQIESHPGYVGVAGKLVKADPAFQKSVDHLMGHVVIAKTLKDANEIAKITYRKYRVVTLDGDVVHPGGSMSGGAQKKTNQSLFTREKELVELTEKLADYEVKAAEFEKQVQGQKQKLVEMEQALQELEETLNTDQFHLQEARTAHKELELKLGSLTDSLSIYDQDKEQYQRDLKTLEDRDIQLDKELIQIEEQLQRLNSKIDMLSKEELEFKENQDQLQQDFHKYQVQLAEQEERVKNQQENHNKLKEQLHEIKQRHHLIENELEELIQLSESQETEEEINEMLVEKSNEKETITQSIQDLRSERMNRTVSLQDEERELKEENRNHQVLMEKLQQKEVKANRIDVELENRLSVLQTEYIITFERAKQDYEKVENIEEAKNEVKAIKSKIDRLGNVNLGAIEEYDRISERYTFLSVQRDDLVQAKETLYSVIKEMDEEMEHLFSTTFYQIKEEFSIVFKELFGGGHAELKLSDPSNLLETGVDIVAQPPGKKLQNLGLLSGGERALTAIALLFAILRVRPVPFCVLDEVEAALDEANVVRFAKYVKHYSENTQFIVITHRQGTMEKADVLYGVTMQESGVSRLVSVRLEETKELIKS
jgi:chromosome segregation protein